ncbi:precorrin-3B synthase [Rhizobium sp. Root1220]|uniref:precorrin-3B synthase n=1 Tax=Rhizobium sp. Root1220 TaxID=1736432 RepID=UPI0006FB7F7D|nr:precorrin-3B synthase [Rhizobium sp. Root1220]KQV70268.1 precorrin-3B synthase [Rhizobium sp. Root1220]
MAVSGIIAGDDKEAGARRGVCPTLSQPMQTGDGLLARLRPKGGAFTISQFIHVAEAAQRLGNGILEITARGSLQIRGLTAETVDQLNAEIAAAGISVPAGPVIELPPLHGISPDEIGPASGMEQHLREQLNTLLLSPGLAPKLSITIDGGGSFGLAEVSADIRLTAISPGTWQVSINGDGRSATALATGNADEAVRTIRRVLQLLLSLGWQKRCRDIQIERLRAVFPRMTGLVAVPSAAGVAVVGGIHALADRTVAIGLKPRFGQMQASEIIEFLARADGHGAKDIRPAPRRGFFLTGLRHEEATAIQQMAPSYGLSPDPNDPSAHIAACAGAGCCASGQYRTKALADKVVAIAPELLDGSMTIHLSGCAKGCAYPRRTFAIVGTSGGYQLVVDGLASDAADAQIAGGDIDSAIERLARTITHHRQAGESAAACLRRLGKGDVTRALRQG